MMLILDADHPYVKNFTVDVYEYGKDGKWKVVWREFSTMKQDNIFDTREDADDLANRLKKNCHIINDFEMGDMPAIFDSDVFWKSF